MLFSPWCDTVARRLVSETFKRSGNRLTEAFAKLG
jgi:hypothetical protein